MTPDQIQTISLIASILKAAGTLPFGVLLVLLVVGPWISMVFVSLCINNNLNKTLKQSREDTANHEKRFEEVVRMYENNVELVNDYYKLSNDLAGIITLSTRTLEGLVQRVDHNQWCPLARKASGKG